MNNQYNRKIAIEKLRQSIAKNAAALEIQWLVLNQMNAKQIARCGELRCQELLLEMAERKQKPLCPPANSASGATAKSTGQAASVADAA